MRITYTTQATDLSVISLVEAKAHLRVTHSDDDNYITALITAARQWVENYCSYKIGSSAAVGYMDTWPSTAWIRIPVHPVTAIGAVKYTDTAGDTQTMTSGDDYKTDIISAPARVYLENTYSHDDGPNMVRVEFTAGVAEGSVPKAMKQAMLILIGGMYEDRQPAITGTIVSEMKGETTIKSLLAPYVLIMP